MVTRWTQVITGTVVLFYMVHLYSCDKDFPKLDHISYYEAVKYDIEALRHLHHVTKRSTSEPIKFEFTAFDRRFHLHLEPDPSVHHANMDVETEQGTQLYSSSNIYRGHLEDESDSYLHGVITKEGHFEGKIITPLETYMIENVKHHFGVDVDFHTFIYRHSDVSFNTSSSTCAHEQLLKKQKELYKINNKNQKTKSDKQSEMTEDDKWHNKYTEQFNANSFDNNMDDVSPERRNRRAVDPTKVTCELYMQKNSYNKACKADHTYYEFHGSDVDTVIEKLTAYVQSVNTIFQTIDFDSSGAADNIGFVIKKIKIYTDPTAQGYKYPGNYDVDYFLDLHSQDNYDDYCLSYMFSHRDFSGGILGLAWIGDLSAIGGVCERYAILQGIGKSLNTGIVTEVNYGTTVPTVVSHITFAHEIGHNFGSPHDPEGDATCVPGGDSGNYIMYARATSGTKLNNNAMSSCSISSINPILEQKARRSSGCFVAYTGQICGNRVVEGTEDCDCGWEEECTEGCCNPQLSNTTGAETPCTRKSSAACSPSEGPCCTDSCQFANTSVVCRVATTCSDNATCGYPFCGSSHKCPASSHRANQTECGTSDDFQVCLNGECTSSICLAYGRESCQCDPVTSGDWTDPRLCQVCCLDGNVCKSSYDLADIPDKEVASGMPCFDFKGYCDVFKKCREVDPTGPLNNIRRLILSGEAIDTLKEFLTDHWYIGLAGGMGLVIIIVLVVKFCSKSHKPRGSDKTSSPRNESRSTRNQVEPFGWM